MKIKKVTDYLIPLIYNWHKMGKVYLTIEDLGGLLDYAQTIEQMTIEESYRDGAGLSKCMSSKQYFESFYKTKSACQYFIEQNNEQRNSTTNSNENNA
jgi:hypothetical protein